MSLPVVFVSYSHLNEDEKRAITTHLQVLEKAGKCEIWYDDMIAAGDFWYDEILKQINRASIAVLLVTAEFLNSKFIAETEVPLILARQREKTLRVFPVIAKPCAWQVFDWLSERNVRPKNGKPIWGNDSSVDTELAQIADEVARAVQDFPTGRSTTDQAAAAAQATTLTAQEVPDTSTSALRVLYIDDDKITALPIKQGLELRGMEVVLETDPRQVTDTLKQRFDVILLDIRMDDLQNDGVDLCVNILAFHLHNKIMLISGAENALRAIDGLKLGASDFILRDKNLNLDEVVQRIHRVVANELPFFHQNTIRNQQVRYLRGRFDTQHRRDLRGSDIEAMLKLLFETISGVTYQKTVGLHGSPREEVSLMFENKSTDRFWSALGDRIWVAIRPWSSTSSPLDLATFKSLIPDEADTGRNLSVVITPSGYSSDVTEYVERKNAANTFPLRVPLTLNEIDTIINSEKYEEGLREAVARWLPK